MDKLNSLMDVQYIGKASMLISEYDGKRYVFSKLRPITKIPVKVYNYIQASRGMHSGDVIPYIPPVITSKPEQKAELKPEPIIKNKPAEKKNGKKNL